MDGEEGSGEDSLHATRAAIEEGCSFAGGGLLTFATQNALG